MQESPESRLLSAGFSRQLNWWVAPGTERVLTLEAAIAALDAGEYPATWTAKTRGLVQPGVAEHARLTEERIRAAEEARQLPPEPPPWLLAQAEVIAAATVEKMKPLIRAEIRAALRKGRSS